MSNVDNTHTVPITLLFRYQLSKLSYIYIYSLFTIFTCKYALSFGLPKYYIYTYFRRYQQFISISLNTFSRQFLKWVIIIVALMEWAFIPNNIGFPSLEASFVRWLFEGLLNGGQCSRKEYSAGLLVQVIVSISVYFANIYEICT